MRPVILSICLCFAFCTPPGFAADGPPSENLPTIGKVVRVSEQLDEVLAPFSRIEVLSTGHEWTEGPVWVPAGGLGQNADEGGFLLFSDIPRNSIFRWSAKAPAAQAVSLFMKPAGFSGIAAYGGEPGSNGLTLDGDGLLVLCEHGDRRVARVTRGGGKRTLADNYQGRRLNSPNDLCFDKSGNIYFTDPIYGLPGKADSEFREIDFCGVYKLTPEGQVSLVTDELTRPNGIGVSPDGKTLYVAQSDPKKAVWMAYPIGSDGSTGPGRVFFDVTNKRDGMKGLPDGLDVDVDGRLWGTGPGGVWVFSPEGKVLGRIDSGEATSNCTFGGPDGSTLFMTCDMYVCRIQTKTRGYRVFE